MLLKIMHDLEHSLFLMISVPFSVVISYARMNNFDFIVI